ncbi:MAG: hypothetical protein ACC644_05550 [Candidatus Hydrothermarchaeales archaeon]
MMAADIRPIVTGTVKLDGRLLNLIRFSLFGATIAVLFMALSFVIGGVFHRFISFSVILILWILCFIFIGMYLAQRFNGVLEVLASDVLTSFLIIAEAVLLLMANNYMRTGSTFDALGGLSVFLLFGPPILIISIAIGSIIKI